MDDLQCTALLLDGDKPVGNCGLRATASVLVDVREGLTCMVFVCESHEKLVGEEYAVTP